MESVLCVLAFLRCRDGVLHFLSVDQDRVMFSQVCSECFCRSCYKIGVYTCMDLVGHCNTALWRCAFIASKMFHSEWRWRVICTYVCTQTHTHTYTHTHKHTQLYYYLNIGKYSLAVLTNNYRVIIFRDIHLDALDRSECVYTGYYLPIVCLYLQVWEKMKYHK